MDADTNLVIIAEKLKQNEAQDLKSPQFISDITSRKYEFVRVIESLSDILTNQDVMIREKGVDFLSWILSEIPPDLFNSQEISSIINFYRDRLKDHPSIASATICGILALVKMKNIKNESLVQILMPIFQEIDCQTLDKSDRYNILAIVSFLVENHFDVVATMGFDFVFGIISVADGETDPLNLLLLFRFLPKFLKNINLGHLMEETFDLLSCYFPIDYTSRENDSVTRKDLSEGLMNCLIARSDFADLCVPLIFDKLEATAKISKIDSYTLLGAGCSTFKVESISKHSKEIWKIMQKDVLPPSDSQLCEAALNALSEVVKLFSSQADGELLRNFLDDILESIKKYFDKVDGSMFRPSVNILMAVCSKSVTAVKYVIGNLKFVNNPGIDDPERKMIALSSLAPFLPVLKACELARSDEFDLVTLFTDISMFHLKAISCANPEVQKKALLGIQILVDDFDDNLRHELMAAIVGLNFKDWPENRIEFSKILRQLAKIAPSEMLNFVSKFKPGSKSERTDLKTLAFTISAVASEEGITQYAIPELIIMITKTDYFDLGLTCLLNSIKVVDDDQFLKKMNKDYNLVETLINWWIKGTAAKNLQNYTPVDNLSEIIALIVRCEEISFQKSLIDKFIPRLLPGLECGRNESNVSLIEGIFSSVKDIEVLDQFPLLGSRVLDLAIKSKNENVTNTSLRLLASIANKMSDNLPGWLSAACDEIFSSLNDKIPIAGRQKRVSLLNWVVKGLLIADSPYLKKIIPKWFDLMEREDVGVIVADGFKTVLKDESLYLNIKSNCNFKILYRQKFFMYLPMLIEKYESSTSSCKGNYLSALIQLIDSVPKHVVATEMTNIVIVLRNALDSQKQDTLITTTSIIEEFLRDKEAILFNYVHTFVPKFLHLARLHKHMRVRMNALRCLFFYAFYPTNSIIPLKKEVVRTLKFCVDDKKRLVRWEAVRARNRWFLVGAPSEDEAFS